MKKKLSLVLAVAMMLSMLASCGSSSSESTSTTTSTTSSSSSSSSSSTASTESSSSEATVEEVDTGAEPDGVVAGTVASIYSIADCVTSQLPGTYAGGQWMYTMVYDTLFWSPSGMYDDMEGLLVDTYELSDDQLTWVLNLHEDVYFTNGNNLNAQSVISSFEYHTDINNASQLNDVNLYEATGEYQVTLHLNNPDPEFMKKMAIANFSICDTSLYDEYGTSVEAGYMVGSGPYYISDYGVGDYLTFTAKEDYWNENRQAHIETIDCKVILDVNAQATALASGAMDYGSVTDYNIYETLSTYDELDLISKIETIAFRPIWFNASTEHGYTDIFNNIRVREAISMMVDHDEIAMAYSGGYGEAGNNAISSYIDYSHERVYDPEGGLAILAEEGIDPSDIVLTAISPATTVSMFTNLQSQLSQWGITLEFALQDDPAVMTAQRAGEWDIMANNGGITSLVFNSSLGNTLASGAGSPYIFDEELNAIVDEYTDAVLIAASEEEKMEALVDLMQLLDEEYLYICSASSCTWYAFSDSIVNPVVDYHLMCWRPWDAWVA